MRAWLLGYNGPATILSILVVGALMSATSSQLIPSFDHVAVPLGMLTPPVIAMLAGIGVSSRLPTPRRASKRLLGARAMWVTSVVVTAALAAWLVEQAYPVEGAVSATVALTLYTFGIATFLGRGAPMLGAAITAAIVFNAGAFRGATSETWIFSSQVTALVCGGSLLFASLYVALGSSADSRFAH